MASDEVHAPRAIDPALERALTVHRNTVVKAACDALAANYPVVRNLCGDESFFGLAAGYVGHRPPAEPRLNTYGEGFEADLRSHAALQNSPYVADVAAVERLVTEALFAPDAIPLEMGRVEHVLRTRPGLEAAPGDAFAPTCFARGQHLDGGPSVGRERARGHNLGRGSCTRHPTRRASSRDCPGARVPGLPRRLHGRRFLGRRRPGG